MQNFYQLLSVQPTASPEEIKRAFRTEIARYHPDKVQHLGKEFQQMAAERAAALTEAYRTLMNGELRAEYDQSYAGAAASGPVPPPDVGPRPAPPPASRTPPHDPPPSDHPGAGRSVRFASELRDRDDFVRKATLDRFRQALAAEMGTVEPLTTRGFDLDCVTRIKRLFSRDSSQRVAVRFVSHVDPQAVQDAWSAAQKLAAPICVFLMGNGMAPARELAETIAELRKRTRSAGSISLIPVDVRDWSAHMPADAPASCKGLLKRLREASPGL